MQQTDEFFLLIYHYSVQGKSAHETNSELLSISSPSNQYLQATSIENCPQPLAVVQRASGGSSCLCRASGAHPDASQTGFLPVHFQLLTARNQRWGWYLEGLHFEQKAAGWLAGPSPEAQNRQAAVALLVWTGWGQLLVWTLQMRVGVLVIWDCSSCLRAVHCFAFYYEEKKKKKKSCLYNAVNCCGYGMRSQ